MLTSLFRHRICLVHFSNIIIIMIIFMIDIM